MTSAARPSNPADDPVLAFVNSIRDEGKTRKSDSFATGEDLVLLLRDAGLDVSGQPVGQAQLRSLRTFREAVYGILSAVAAGRAVPREDEITVQIAIKSAMADASIDLSQGRAFWRPGPLGGLQDSLALRLADFLAAPEISRLRECRRCTRLFLDHGRGPGRRWCSMERCGNRNKVETFRARQRKSRPLP